MKNNKAPIPPEKKKKTYIDKKDIVINIYDNKVKVTHTPTNTVIESCKYNSHYKNKIEALSTLRKILLKKSTS